MTKEEFAEKWGPETRSAHEEFKEDLEQLLLGYIEDPEGDSNE